MSTKLEEMSELRSDALLALEVMFYEFLNARNDEFEPIEEHEAETQRNIERLYDIFRYCREVGAFPLDRIGAGDAFRRVVKRFPPSQKVHTP